MIANGAVLVALSSVTLCDPCGEGFDVLLADNSLQFLPHLSLPRSI